MDSPGRCIVDNNLVLLVEDNIDDEKLALRALRHAASVKVHVCRDGVEALDFLLGGNTGEPKILPAVVLLDLKLPRVSGLEVLKALRKDARTDRLPVVVLTSSNEDKDVDAGYRSGANSYICKPVDFDKFINVVQMLGMYWLETNRKPS